ncbi:RecB family exonuclease [Patescibacteria group bacterium]
MIKEKAEDFHIDYLSYSQINTFSVCPLHYKLRYILKVPVVPSAALSFGTSIHSTMKDFYNLVKTNKKPTRKLLIDLLSTNWEKEGFKTKAHEEKYFKRGKDYLTNYLKKEYNPKITTEVIEQSFVAPLPKKKGERRLKIGGKIDRVDTFSDGSIEVVDYKTSVRLPTQRDIDNDLQLTFYALAVALIREEPFKKNPEEISLSLYFFEEQRKLTTKRTRQQLESAVDEIYEWRKKIKNSDFKCSGNYLCGNCEYKMICGSN